MAVRTQIKPNRIAGERLGTKPWDMLLLLSIPDSKTSKAPTPPSSAAVAKKRFGDPTDTETGRRSNETLGGGYSVV